MYRSLSAISALSVLFAAPAVAQTREPARQTTIAGLPVAAAVQTVRTITFDAAYTATDGTLILPLSSAEDLALRGADLDQVSRDSLARALKSADFKYAAASSLSLRGIGEWRRILVIGLGGKDKADATALQNAGMVAGRALIKEEGPATVLLKGASAQDTATFVTGVSLGQYRSDIYGVAARKPSVSETISVVSENAADASKIYANRGEALVKAMIWTRDISNEPANVVYPESFVDRTRAAFNGTPGVTIEVLDTQAMERLGMGSILAIGRASERGPRLLVVRYRGAGAPDGGPVVLAGKGITFDSGGVSIKPSANMGDMKFDMSGAASVTGAVLSLAKSGAPVNVIAIAALAENMPGGHAIRPGDIVQAMNGKTIEIISTDAEGRMVLADALSWAQAKLKPAVVVDVATLTGAVMGALGDDYAGLFSNRDWLAQQLEGAAKTSGEAVWRLPLHESYAKDLESAYADLKNGGGAGAGAGVGAQFISEFLNKETPWAHLDIAGVAWAKGATDRTPVGSTGWGVRLLDQFARDYKPVAQ